MARHPRPQPEPRPELTERRVFEAFDRLARHRAFHTLVRGAVPEKVLRRLLRDAVPRNQTAQQPPEVWASLAAGIALEGPGFGLALAEVLHDHLAWDQEPQEMDGWWEAAEERPLEALWMAALSESKAVRKEFSRISARCLEVFRDSPASKPPSWDFVEALFDAQARSARDVRDAEKRAEEAERHLEGERERLADLREELKRLRRENADLRGEKAQAERKAAQAEALAAESASRATAEDVHRLEDLDRKLRKAEKEREHLERELARLARPAEATETAAGPEAEAVPEAEAEPIRLPQPSLSDDPNSRRRVLRQMLRKLVKKGKIGASHTHEDNVYRGVADHDKGVAKEAIDLLYREGYLLPKPTTTDPHVSLRPERMPEIKAIVAGAIENPRLRRFVEGA
jgi:hypothetical protein